MELPKMGFIVCPFHAARDHSVGGRFRPEDDHIGPRNGPCLRIVPDGALFVGRAVAANEERRNTYNYTCFDAPHSYKEVVSTP